MTQKKAKKQRKFVLEITLTGDCLGPSDIGYTLSEIGEELSNQEKWDKKTHAISADTSAEEPNGFWKVA